MISSIPCVCGRSKTWYAEVCRDCYWRKFRTVTNEQRFWSKVKKTDHCWLWTGGKTDYGYGQFHFRSGEYKYKNISAHRYAWELINGPIPEGMVIDHKVCDNPACCNPAHLIVTTNWDNISRSDKCPSKINSLKTHCLRGHPLIHNNLYRAPSSNQRACKACMVLTRRSRTGAKPRKFKIPRIGWDSLLERTESDDVLRV
jgi:hypothetical protein